jgi:predicted metal-dependent hydrolase
MQVRTPKWDFSKVRAHWAPNHEFAQMYNAASTVPAYIEPYLVQVMRKAQAALDPKEEGLHRDLEIFIRQEMQHCKQHINFNKALRADGYEGMASFEASYNADYQRFLETKSLRFNCAYSEGFEAMSAIAVTSFFEEFDELLEGADPEAVELWKWHLAEEHEHREVAHDVYHALFGQNPVFAYFYRLYGFVYAVSHIRAHIGRVTQFLLAKDREGMSAEQIAQSKIREAHAKKVMSKRAREHLKDIFSPFYKPGRRRDPRGVIESLRKYEKTGSMAASVVFLLPAREHIYAEHICRLEHWRFAAYIAPPVPPIFGDGLI